MYTKYTTTTKQYQKILDSMNNNSLKSPYNNMQVKNIITSKVINGEEVNIVDNVTLEVSSVKSDKDSIELKIGEGDKIRIKAFDLLKAIQNATNNEQY